jgi:signal transduction histidine kinase
MSFSVPIPLTLRYLEWIFIAIHILMYASDSSHEVEIIDRERFLLYGAFIILSCIFPANRPNWQKQGYIYLGLLLAVLLNFFGVATDLLVYLYIAKSCFLLDRKNLWAIVFIGGIAWVFSEIWSESIKFPQTLRFVPPYGFGSYDLRTIAIYSLGIYIAGSIWVILFSYTIVAEQKSRQKAENLARKVETLAASLERTRIARDIHDSLGHTLTNLDIQLEVAQKLRQRDLDKAFQAVDMAKMLASQCIEDISHALKTMRQSDFNLDRALEKLLEQMRQNQSLRVHWEVDLPKLSLQTSHQIYCIVKEGLINIQKHARASRVFFQGRSTPKEIILELEDDGIGFNPDLLDSGFGLKGMTERVKLLNGDLRINSTRDRGTRIQVIIPISS